MMASRWPSQGGFTLLEVLVALAISALAIAMLLQAIGGATGKLTGRASDGEATALAARIMEAALTRPANAPGIAAGREGSFDWRLQAAPIRRAEPLALQRVRVEVTRSGQSVAVLTSARIVMDAEK